MTSENQPRQNEVLGAWAGQMPHMVGGRKGPACFSAFYPECSHIIGGGGGPFVMRDKESKVVREIIKTDSRQLVNTK